MKMNNKNFLTKFQQNLWGFAFVRIITFLINLRFFEIVNKKDLFTLNDLVEYFNWSQRPSKLLIRYLIKLGLIRKIRDNKYELTKLANDWFIKEGNHFINDFVKRTNRLLNAYDDLEDLFINDKPNNQLYKETMDAFGKDFELTGNFVNNMHSMTSCFEDELINNIDFSNTKSILDIGTGIGSISVSVINSNKNIYGDIIDLPGVTHFTFDYIKKECIYPKQLNIISNDWSIIKTYKNSYDLIILSQVLHEFKEGEINEIINECVRLLSPNGKIVIAGFFNNIDINNELDLIFSFNMLLELGSDNPELIWLKQQFSKQGLNCTKETVLPGHRVMVIFDRNIKQ